MTELYIFGAGGHGHDILAMIKYDIETYDNLHFKGFFDDQKFTSREVVGTFDDNLINRQSWRKCAIGLNWPKDRYNLLTQMKHWEVQNIISKNADIGYDPEIGYGVIIGQFTTLGYKTLIGDHVHIGANVAIHRGDIGDWSTICPGATICGDVYIGRGVTIGAGATISNLVTIGDWATIGAGAVVVNDIPAGATVKGNPAR